MTYARGVSSLATFFVVVGAHVSAHAQCSYESPETPLIDLTGTYMGETGGLYGDGNNTPPAALFTEGRRRALDIRPIDGAVVMISVGMSNTTQEFSSFVPLAMGHPDVNPELVVVDGAQGSEPAQAWVDPDAATWTEVDRRLMRAGVRPEQVQVAWVKQAMPNPRDGFPGHALTLQGYLEDIARALRTNYPNIQLAFFSSRTRACTERSLNPEPYAYESAFSVRWLIEAQQSGDASLDPSTRAPLVAWGPYLWAKATPSSDGFAWPCTSVRTDDCTHPAPSGRMLVAEQLLAFFTTDPLAAPWFLRPGLAPDPDAGMPDPDAGAPVDAGTDADVVVDAGPMLDSGSDDAGLDASSGADSGMSESGGGGCAASRAPAGSMWILIALAVFRRRVHSSQLHE